MTEDSNTVSTPGGRSEGMGAPCLALFETWGYCFWIPQSPSPTRCPSDAERSGGQKESGVQHTATPPPPRSPPDAKRSGGQKKSAVQPKATRPDIPPFWPLPNCHPERSEGPAF